MDQSLTPELVLQAYRVGAFPMADDHGEIWWFSPDPRCILPLDRFHVPRSLRQTIRRGTFEVRIDTAFDEVIRCCADRPEGTWISDEIRMIYRMLHQRGFAHSVECWQSDGLAGGLYGVALGGAFCGESMFWRVSNASKVALVALVERLRAHGFILLDTQWITPHLKMFGALEVPRSEYIRRLKIAVSLPAKFGDPD